MEAACGCEQTPVLIRNNNNCDNKSGAGAGGACCGGINSKDELSNLLNSLRVGSLDEREITLLSPSSPHPEEAEEKKPKSVEASSKSEQIFAHHLQMKLKSHLLESSSEECSSTSSEEFFTNSSSSHEDDTNTTSSTEIFYDFDDVVYPNGAAPTEVDDELTSDYGTGGSNSTIIGEIDRDHAELLSNGSSRSGSTSSSANGGEEEKAAAGEEDEEDEEGGSKRGKNIRYQRSSSLKSGKTPPGTPMKKIVRFADAMGLDLIDIKLFLDEIPKIPKEAYRDLHIPDYIKDDNGSTAASANYAYSQFDFLSRPFGMMMGLSNNNNNNDNKNTLLNFVPLFHQPVSMPDFFDKIRDQKVLLENAYLTQETINKEQNDSSPNNKSSSSVTVRQVIKGTVRVMNLDFHKSVYVRYTYNDWKEFYEFQATYIPGSCDGFSDRFEFRIEIDESKLPPPYLRELYDDAKISFACRFHCSGNQFWDNNQSRNYVFQNVPVVRSPASSAVNNNNNNVSSSGRSQLFGVTSSRYSSFDDFDNEDGSSTGLIGKSKSSSVILPPLPPIKASKKSSPISTPTDNNVYKNYVNDEKTKKDYDYSSSANKIQSSCGYDSTTTSNGSSSGGGGGSHLSGSLYSPVGFYESAYGCYANQYGSACFY